MHNNLRKLIVTLTMVENAFCAVAANCCSTVLYSGVCGVTGTTTYWSVCFIGVHVLGRDVAPTVYTDR